MQMSPYLQQGNDSWNGFVMQSWTVGIRKDTKDSWQDPRRKDFGCQQNENIKINNHETTKIHGRKIYILSILLFKINLLFAPALTWILVPGFILLA